MQRALQPAMAQPASVRARYSFSYISGAIRSSESTKPMYWPRAASRPALLALAGPPLGLWITRMRLSLAAHSSQSSPQPLGLPSSTRISSKSVRVWARMLRMVRGR